ncbi:MAG: YbjN domain-containing protein [Synechococcus sp.]
MEFKCNQLSDDVLKSIFDAAFIDTEVDDDGDLFVTDDMRVLVEGLPDQDCFQFTAYFGIDKKHSRESLLEACNSFNTSYLGLKAGITDGSEAIVFNYAVLMKGGGAIEAKEIIRLFKYFQDVVSASLEDEILSFISER